MPQTIFGRRQRIEPIYQWLTAGILLISIIAPEPARAQLGEGVVGWTWNGVGYATPTEACYAMWQQYKAPSQRFIGAFYGTPTRYGCYWTTYQYLCPSEAPPGQNGIGSCGTILPTSVDFYCASGYHAAGEGVCIKDVVNQGPGCSGNAGGTRNDTVGNPVLITSGAKLHEEEDFTTTDHRLSVKRYYRSTTQLYNNNPLWPAYGTLKGWAFWFAVEWQLQNSGSWGTLYLPTGEALTFVLDSSGTKFVPADPAIGNTNYSIEYVGTPPSDWSTVVGASSQWRVREKQSGRIWLLQTFKRYSSSTTYNFGRPSQIIDSDGYTQSLTYNSLGEVQGLTDTLGRSLTFTWRDFIVTTVPNYPDTDPVPEMVSKITMSDGTSISYTYDPPVAGPPSVGTAQRLASVSWLNANGSVADSVSYQYEDTRFPHLLTGITDGRGVRYGTYAYDGQARATSSEHAGSQDKYTIAYGGTATTQTRTVTNPLGKAATFTYDWNSGNGAVKITSVTGQASTNCPSSTRGYTYDANNYIASETDEEGRVTSYVRDVSGRPTSITRGAGTANASTTTMTWQSDRHFPTQTVEPGRTTSFTWDATTGRLVSRTQTDTTTQTVPYSTNGQTRTWTYAYGTNGLLQSVDGPLAGSGDKVSYTYDTSGFVKTITDQVGHVTTVNSVNARGEPTSVTDANSVVTALTYDARGRLLTTTIASGTAAAATTTFTYDGAGDITKVTDPAGSYFSYTWDNARRLTKVTNNLGETINYTRNAMGDVTAVSRKKSDGTATYTRSQAFDELGRLLKSIGAASQTWTMGYDKTDNLTAVTDPRTNVYSYAFDALNRLIKETNQENSAVTLTRNGVDDVTAYQDPRSLSTTYVRNGFGEVIQEVSPDRGTTTYVRDARGLVTQKTDARGIVANTTYDNAGRWLTQSFPAATAENVTSTYDATAGGNKGVGRRTGMSDASGTTAWVYDARGNVLSETRVIGGKTYATAYAYDAADHVVSITYPSGRIVSFTRDAMGRILGATTKQTAAAASVTLAQNIAYNPYSILQWLTYGNGLSLYKTFTADEDPAMLLVEIPGSTTFIKRFYVFSEDNVNLTKIYDDLDATQNQSFWYSAANRLQNASGPWGALTYYVDGVGNRTYEISTVGSTTSTKVSGYPSTSNRIANVTTDGTVTRTFGHDAAGNLATDTKSGVTWTYSYNNAGRMSQAKAGTSVVGTYTYDGLDRLAVRAVTNTTPSGTTHLVYDQDGHVIAEANATSGTTVREYVWVDDLPIAVESGVDTGSPTLLYVHPDHLNRPILMTNAATKAVVWKAVYKPFGEVYAITGSATLDVRFPGQWFQLETGLHYNWHRHYDPTTGRYTQPDPLGFVDGPSVYAYVRNSPVMKVDPEGLANPLEVACLAGPNPVCGVGIAADIAAAAIAAIVICEIAKSERRTSRSPGGAGSPYQRCLAAANGSEDDWGNFCGSIPFREKNNVVGEGSAKIACLEHRFSSKTEKRNWCENQYGRH